MRPAGKERSMPWLAHLYRKLHPAPAPVAAPCPCVPVETPVTPWASLPARPRLPLVLVRALGAQCPICDGLGCEVCAQTGLR
jgi:hypothetical protein